MSRIVLASLTLSGLLLAACGGDKALTTAPDPNTPQGVTHDVSAGDRDSLSSKQPIAGNAAVLYVNGLGCPLCATNIDKQLLRSRGIKSATVDLGAGTVLVDFREGAARPSPYQLKEIVADAGFTLMKVETR